ncbi:MAG: hypothetical protein ACXAEB_04245 [Candidatus Thorarchaeota archaeon]
MKVMSRASRIIPVLDIIDGVVVHAVAGQREKYKPITSKIVDGLKLMRSILQTWMQSET